MKMDGHLEPPDDNGVIRKYDENGNLEEIRQPGDANYEEWLAVFE